MKSTYQFLQSVLWLFRGFEARCGVNGINELPLTRNRPETLDKLVRALLATDDYRLYTALHPVSSHVH
jgi:hypothetical protein